MADTSWEQLNKRMKQLFERHKVMDESEELANQKDFHLTTFDGKSFLDNVINVTGNYAPTFADAVSSDLLSAKWQTVIEGDIPSKQAHDIEQFVDDNFEQADEQLLNQFGLSSLMSWLSNHVCVRSFIGVKWISEIADGQYKIDCLPVDMRWCGWVFGENGLVWVAPMFFKNSDEFMNDPDYKDSQTKLIANTDYAQVDWWNKENHEVWVAKGDTYDPTSTKGTRIFDEKNTLGYPPFVIVLPSTGFMLRGKNWIANESPDVFWLNRKLYKEANRSLSIEQTIGMDILYPPYEREVENITGQPSKPVPKSGESLDVKKGERHQPVPRGDLNRASVQARQDILTQIATGGVSDAELGAAGLDRPGIWFAKQFEIRHKREKPLFEALAMMKEGLARMMIKQFIESEETGGELLIGRTGRRNKFSAKMLGDPDSYRISFKYNISSKEMEIVNLAQAQAAQGVVPQKIITRDILQAEDPDEWDRMLELEKAKAANPAIGLLEMSVSYAEEAEELEDEGDKAIKVLQSKILLHDYVMMMRQRLNPQPEETGKEEAVREATETKPNLQGLMSMPKMLGAGGLARGKAPQQEE